MFADKVLHENISLKQDLRNMKAKLELLANTKEDNSSTADVLRRLSNLEKIVYDKDR